MATVSFRIQNTGYVLWIPDTAQFIITTSITRKILSLSDTSSGTTLNATRIQATNIVGGPYIAGNFWATPEGDGFSQTEVDTDGDGICNAVYTLSNESIDYLPLAVIGWEIW